MMNNLEEVLDALKEQGCSVGGDVPRNYFNDKFIDVNGVTRCARYMCGLSKENFIAEFTKATTKTNKKQNEL